MNRTRRAQNILWYQGLGFLAIVILSWLDELVSLPALLFGGPTSGSWRESATESLVIVAVWVLAYVWTRRLLRRLVYLEDFLRVCAWCRKVNDAEEWISFEHYFDRNLGTKSSHGICPECLAKVMPSPVDSPQSGAAVEGSGAGGRN